MSDWRIHSANGDWEKIDGMRLRERDANALRKVLAGIVPTCIRGDGVETFRDFIKPSETNDPQIASAAHLLSVISWPRYQESPPLGTLFLDSVQFAKKTLLAVGISYVGMHQTFLYRQRTGEWRQVRPCFGNIIDERRTSNEYESYESFKTDNRAAYLHQEIWRKKYPWRRAEKLHSLWRWGEFLPNSAADHALHLLDAHRVFQEVFQGIVLGRKPGNIGRRGGRAVDAMFLAQIAFEIGRHHDALLKKPIEPLAIRRRDQIIAFAYNNEGRDAANAERSIIASQWNIYAREIAQRTTLSGMARATWVRNQLIKLHGIDRSVKTIAKALTRN